jgi:hypothetical protein
MPTVLEGGPVIMASSLLSAPETDPSKCRKVNDSSSNVKCVMLFLIIRCTDMEKNNKGL